MTHSMEYVPQSLLVLECVEKFIYNEGTGV